MSLFNLPIQPNFPWYFFKITLTGVVYTLRLRYNSRMQRWILDIADSLNNDLLVGLPVLINRDVNGQYVISGVPPGVFFATDDTSQGTQPTLLSFSLDHSLVYADDT